jgi:osmoprotectant transport system substrate-binding protein
VRKVLAGLAAAMLLFVACESEGGGGPITVGSGNFPESIILGEIYAQALEAEGFEVEKNLDVGTRDQYLDALEKEEIDLVPEYIGALTIRVTGDSNSATTDSRETHNALIEALEELNLTALEYAPAQDKDGVVVNKETADAHSLTKFSDLRPVAGQLVMGAPAECDDTDPETGPRFCARLIAEGINFREIRSVDAGLVDLLKSNEVQAANIFSTDGSIAREGFVSLEDDLGVVPAENIVPVIRDEVVEAHGDDLVEFLNSITAKITTEDLTDLNNRATREVDPEDPEDVAADWLQENEFD